MKSNRIEKRERAYATPTLQALAKVKHAEIERAATQLSHRPEVSLDALHAAVDVMWNRWAADLNISPKLLKRLRGEHTGARRRYATAQLRAESEAAMAQSEYAWEQWAARARLSADLRQRLHDLAMGLNPRPPEERQRITTRLMDSARMCAATHGMADGPEWDTWRAEQAVPRAMWVEIIGRLLDEELDRA